MSQSQQLSIKYRPTTFADTIGQDQAKSTLSAIAKAEGITARSLLLQGNYGTGKCQRYDTVITTNKGLRRLGDLFPTSRVEGTDYDSQGLKVFVGGSFHDVSALYYSGVKDTVKLSLSNGEEVEGSLHHKYKVWSGDKVCFEWKTLQDIQEGDLLCSDETFVVSEGSVSELYKFDFSYTGSGAYKNKDYSLPEFLDEDTAYFLGLMVGDGCYTVTAGNPSITTQDEEIKTFVEVYLSKYGGCRTRIDTRTVPQADLTTSVNWREFYKYLGIYGQSSYTKTVPACVWLSPLYIQVAFVRGLMDSDGSVDEGKRVELSMGSKEVVFFAKHVMNSLGIAAKLKRKTTGSGKVATRLLAPVSNNNMFLLFSLKRKRDALIISNVRCQNHYSCKYTNLESVFLKKYTSLYPEGLRGRGVTSLERDRLGNFISNCRNTGISAASYHEPLLQSKLQEYGLLMHDIVPFGSSLVKVDKKEFGRCELFDLTVPSVHYYRANGLYSHNTTLARIFGKAVNCPQFRKTGDVCNTCQSCLEVDSGVSTLYKEFDATLVGSVEGVKQLVSSLILSAPNSGFRRVVVLDEVHACSTAAQTALLKVLEEGIPNTFFAFCTTHSVIPTIVSRSTLIPFTTIPHDLLFGLVSSIAHKEMVDVPEDISHMIVAKSQGHARNAVSLLDSYLRIGQDAVASSYYNFSQMMSLAMQKGADADIKFHLNKVLSYSLVDINFVVSEFLRRCYLRQGSLETHIGNSGLTSKFLSFFYQNWAVEARKDERGVELLLLDFISLFK